MRSGSNLWIWFSENTRWTNFTMFIYKRKMVMRNVRTKKKVNALSKIKSPDWMPGNSNQTL